MARSWLITSRGIAKKIKETGHSSSKQINELSAEAKRECPSCNYVIDNSDVNIDWPGFPAGCKFDPSDVELIKHLEGKVGISESHMLIDEFIPTIMEVEGICYKHPEDLPGIKKDGNCTHFFHKISNAYAIGPRKRRKINTGDINSSSVEHVRWHKTGKTKPIIENGIQKGWKKIMVLYKNKQRGSKPDKANWVMHQYHLGMEEEEKDGQMVVSKIFYQLGKEKEQFNLEYVDDKNGIKAIHAGTVCPKTPMLKVPQPPRCNRSNQVDLTVDNVKNDDQDIEHQVEPTSPAVSLKDGGSVWLENEPQAVKEPDVEKSEGSFLCHEVLDPLESFLEFDLYEDIMSSPPDLSDISELPMFGSQDSMSAWWQNQK